MMQTSKVLKQLNFILRIIFRKLSISGQEIQTAIISNSEKHIDVSALPEGIYFLKLFDNNKSLGQQKFMKSAE